MIKHIARTETTLNPSKPGLTIVFRVLTTTKNKLEKKSIALLQIEQSLQQMEALTGLTVSVINELSTNLLVVKVEGSAIRATFITGLVRNAVEGQLTKIIGAP